MRASTSVRDLLLAAMALWTLSAFGPSCGADARGADACRRLESARCERAQECIEGFSGTEDSCKRFYDVHCGSGVQPTVKDPTSTELAQCLQAIGTRCDAVRDPTTAPECAFLQAIVPVVDAGAEAAVDGAATPAVDVLDAD